VENERDEQHESLPMERADLEAFLATFRGAEASYPFGPEVLVYKVRGKLFAFVSQDAAPSVTLKCNPEDGELLVSQFRAVKLGYHMNKRHWLTVTLSDDVPDAVLRGLTEDSYALVVKGLTKSVREELERS